MFKNMKTATKVVAGFGMMLVILVGLGIVSYVMFGRVTWNVTNLNDHSLSAVKNSTVVERSAYDAIVQEKNFVLYKKGEFYQNCKKKIGEADKGLEQLLQVAEKFNDADLAEKAKEIRAQNNRFSALMDETSAATTACENESKKMTESGVSLTKESDAFFSTKHKQHNEAKEACSLVTRIETLSWKTRYTRQKLKLTKEDKWLDTLKENGKTLAGYYDRLEKLNPAADEQKMIALARKATETYIDSAVKYSEEQKRDENSAILDGLDKLNSEAGSAAEKIQEEYLTYAENKSAKIFESLIVAAEIAKTAPNARVAARVYMMERTPERLANFNESIAKIEKLCAEAAKSALTQEDQQRIDQTDKSAKDYAAGFNGWVVMDKKLKEVTLPELKKCVESVVSTVQASELNSWKAADEATESVLSIASTSKLTIIVAQIIGMAVALGSRFPDREEHFDGDQVADRRIRPAVARRRAGQAANSRQSRTGERGIPADSRWLQRDARRRRGAA